MHRRLFAALLAFALAAQKVGAFLLHRVPRRTWLPDSASTRTRLVSCTIALTVLVVAVFDQVPVHAIGRADRNSFRTAKAFFARVQSAFPAGTAFFELPYNYFPESPRPPSSYYLLEPYLLTDGMRWSFGDMHGRASDAWNAQVAELSGKQLSDALASAGFGAIYVDRRGYKDHAADVERMLLAQFGQPVIADDALGRAVYGVPKPGPTVPSFVVADLGRNWFPWQTDAGADSASAWSKGTADILIANPGGGGVTTVSFKLSSLVSRKVSIRYGAEILSVVYPKPNETVDVAVTFTAQKGVSRLTLQTETPAVPLDGGDKRNVAIRLSDLAYQNILPR